MAVGSAGSAGSAPASFVSLQHAWQGLLAATCLAYGLAVPAGSGGPAPQGLHLLQRLYTHAAAAAAAADAAPEAGCSASAAAPSTLPLAPKALLAQFFQAALTPLLTALRQSLALPSSTPSSSSSLTSLPQASATFSYLFLQPPAAHFPAFLGQAFTWASSATPSDSSIISSSSSSQPLALDPATLSARACLQSGAAAWLALLQHAPAAAAAMARATAGALGATGASTPWALHAAAREAAHSALVQWVLGGLAQLLEPGRGRRSGRGGRGGRGAVCKDDAWAHTLVLLVLGLEPGAAAAAAAAAAAQASSGHRQPAPNSGRPSSAAPSQALLRAEAVRSLLARYGGQLEEFEVGAAAVGRQAYLAATAPAAAAAALSSTQAQLPLSRESRALRALAALSPQGARQAAALQRELELPQREEEREAVSEEEGRGALTQRSQQHVRVHPATLPALRLPTPAAAAAAAASPPLSAAPPDLPTHLPLAHLQPLLLQAHLLHTADAAALLLQGDLAGHAAALRTFMLLGGQEGGLLASLALAGMLGLGYSEEAAWPEWVQRGAWVQGNAAWEAARVDVGMQAAAGAWGEAVEQRGGGAAAAAGSGGSGSGGSGSGSGSGGRLALLQLAARVAVGCSPAAAHSSRFLYLPPPSAAQPAAQRSQGRPRLAHFLAALQPAYRLTPGLDQAARVITPHSLRRYAAMHAFLLLLKGTCAALAQARLWLRGLQARSSRRSSSVSGVSIQATPLYLLCHTASHVTGAVEGYVAEVVVEGGWQAWCRRVEGVVRGGTGLWQGQLGTAQAAAQADIVARLREAHDEYTAALLEHAFLPPVEGCSSGGGAGSGSSSGGVAHALLTSLLDTALEFTALVRECWVAGWAGEGLGLLAEAVPVLSRRFRGTVRSLVGGLRATVEGGAGFRERAQDLLARLGPLGFLDG